MAGRDPKRKRPAGKHVAGKARPVVKHVLGNDPFERGAAPRPPVTVAPPERAADESPLPPPVSVMPLQAAAAALRDVERGDEAATAADRLGDLAREEAAGQHARDLLGTLAGLLPALRQGLASLASLRRLLEGPGEPDHFGMDRELAARAEPVLEFFYRTWWRAQVRGAEHVPADGPVVVVANHGGALPWDALVLRLALLRDHPAHRDLRPVLDEQALKFPILGGLVGRLGAVPATPENGARLLRERLVMGVFPEGSRAGTRPWPERYRILSFGRGGFAKLAVRAGASIVPCAIVGSEETSAPPARAGWIAEQLGLPLLLPRWAIPLGPLGFLPLPARWSLRFGEPIETASLGAAAADDTHKVLELTERAREALQGMLDEDVVARRSVYL